MPIFTFLFKFLQDILTLSPFQGILGLNWSCVVTGRPEFSIFQNLDFIIEPPAKINPNAKFQLFITFSGEFMWRYIYRGIIQGKNCPSHVTSLQPPYLTSKSFSDHVSYMNFDQHIMSFPTIYNTSILEQFEFFAPL